MNFKSKFVAIGGKSGVGKTTLIQSLVMAHSDVFSRPLSYTTRAKRMDDDKSEYVFITKDEIIRLYEQGKLANLDLNYGNYYAMDRDKLLQDMNSTNRIIIKEIHPKYHYNIKELIGDNYISVLIKELTPQGDIRGRGAEDDRYYAEHNENEFDLVYMYDKSTSKEENANNFYQRLMVYINTCTVFPPAKDIDTQNALGYSKVAAEFTEERRITTRNFHDVSKTFWNSFVNTLNIRERVLELGSGNGWLRYSFDWPDVNYYCVDIAAGMKSVLNTENGLTASVRCIPIKSKSIDCVVASLADPYFYPEMLCEINRILKDEALFVATLPDKEWADSLRGEKNHKTSFVLDSGDTATVFSFTFSDEEFKYLAKECGFSVCKLEHFSGAELRRSEISPAITSAAEKKNKPVDDLNIITAIIWKKRKTKNERK